MMVCYNSYWFWVIVCLINCKMHWTMPIEQFLLIPVFVVRFCVSLFVLRLKSLNSQYSCSDLKRKIVCYQFELGNNLVTFRLNTPVVVLSPWWRLEHSVKMSASYFPKLKLVTDNLLFIYVGANWEATGSLFRSVCPPMNVGVLSWHGFGLSTKSIVKCNCDQVNTNCWY